MRHIELVEEESTQVPVGHLDAVDLGHFQQQFERQINIQHPTAVKPDFYTFRSRGYVGHIGLGRKVQLHIRPKVPIRHLFALLEWVYDLAPLHMGKALANCRTVGELFGFLAAVLARRVLERQRQGLIYAYKQHTQSLPYIRGRLQVERMAMHANAQLVPCSYRAFSRNTEDNGILVWTLFYLKSMAFLDAKAQQLVHQALKGMGEEIEIKPYSAWQCLGRVYHQLNSDYRPMHALCRFFLDHGGPGMGAGKQLFPAYLIHMPRLFEAFVGAWLARHVPQKYRLLLQHRVPLEGSDQLAFQIDMALEDVHSGEIVAVLDTKYKRLNQPDESDIQQVVAYAVRLGCPRAVLVYPWAQMKSQHIRVGQVVVQIEHFDISAEIAVAGRAFLNAILPPLKLN